MKVALIIVALTIAASGLSVDGAFAADAAGFTLDGQVQKPGPMTASDLKALPATTVTVSFLTGHGQETGTYGGALLWTLLTNATIVDGPTKSAHLSHTILVTGSDGYSVALSMGELDPKFEGKSVIIATTLNGQPLPAADGLRLIVPGDTHGGRAVRDVVHVEVR
jgi:DMSO/TMAO reductase YedYZ molybdopterin-dependent catalytic subunit